jgi:hypothetical protein
MHENLCSETSLPFAAKKIPIEHILAATRGAAGRPGAAGGRAGSQTEGGVSLDSTAKPKEACNC